MSKTEIPESFPSDPNEVFNLAVDGMGGDGAPEVVVAGLAVAAERHRNIKVLLIGDEARLLPLLAKYPKAASICTVWHTDVSVPMDMKPTSALRMRQSSMRHQNTKKRETKSKNKKTG